MRILKLDCVVTRCMVVFKLVFKLTPPFFSDIMATLFGFSGGLGFNRNWWDEHEHDGGMDTETIINGALGNRKTSFDGSFVDEHGGTIYLLDESDVFSCAKCHTHLASKDMIMSRAFQGRSGRCYLFETCVNCKLGNEEERMLITGRHVVRN